MGFNNGYDSGYTDCEIENRKKWEERAVAKYIASAPAPAPEKTGLTSAFSVLVDGTVVPGKAVMVDDVAAPLFVIAKGMADGGAPLLSYKAAGPGGVPLAKTKNPTYDIADVGLGGNAKLISMAGTGGLAEVLESLSDGDSFTVKYKVNNLPVLGVDIKVSVQKTSQAVP